MADITEKDLDSLRKKNEKLVDQIAEEERKLADAMNQATLQNDHTSLENENERLAAKLANLKEQVKHQKSGPTPVEQAEAAQKAELEAANTPPSDDDKDGK